LSLQAANSELRLLPFSQTVPFIAERLRRAVREREACSLVLAGGRTPRGVYEQLPAAGVPWERVRWFWGDERFVPPDHEASNYRMARESLLERIRPPDRNVFPIPTDAGSPQEAARRYERMLRGLFPGAAFPAFDLVLLGLGADGHTASLFPGGPECEERSRWCLASFAPAGTAVRERVTLTLPVLNAARCVAFLVTGEDKRNALSALLAPGAVAELPAQRVRAARSQLHVAGELFCFTDLPD
jgi:6-phosphogluconolactonase